jgi:hypothetical protein
MVLCDGCDDVVMWYDGLGGWGLPAHTRTRTHTRTLTGVHVVSGTPGRVYDMIKRRALKTKSLKMLVIDEAVRPPLCPLPSALCPLPSALLPPTTAAPPSLYLPPASNCANQKAN